MNRSNTTWVEDIRCGGATQDGALAELRSLLIPGLRGALRSRTGVDDSFLEDVVQETLIKVLKNLDQFEGRSRFTTWAISIGVRLAFTELRKRHWKNVSLDQVIENAGSLPNDKADPSATPELVVQRKAMIEKMYQIIHQDLSAKQRDALLAELQGMPQEEIGRRMGSNRNAIYKLTHDARKRLKKGLEASGYTAVDLRAVFGG